MKHRFFTLLLLSFLSTQVPGLLSQEQIVVIGWNAESGDANPEVVAGRIADIEGCDLWGIVEVQNADWAAQFEQAASTGEDGEFDDVLGTTGSNSRDLMQIIYNDTRFELVRFFELHRINVTGRVRAPLVAHFKIRNTKIEFLFMVNHLYRSRADRRHEQARLLNAWARNQTLPVIAVGDYNFDWEVDVGEQVHDPGYDLMVAEGHFNWVRPDKLKKTQASSDYDSVLDFVFLGGPVWTWKAESTILPRDDADTVADEFDDDSQTSDHRPVRATFKIE